MNKLVASPHKTPLPLPLPLKHQKSLNPFAKSFESIDKSLDEYYNDPNNFRLPTQSTVAINNKSWSQLDDGPAVGAVINPVVNQPPRRPENNGMTEEDRTELFDEPLNTQNALVATMGYNPKDDKRICPFYDPQIDGCFKGSHCRLEHVSKLKGWLWKNGKNYVKNTYNIFVLYSDGWTRDQVPFKLDSRCVQSLPSVGLTVEMIPTHVFNTNTFYANIPSLNPPHAPTQKQVIMQMNSPEIRAKMKPLTHLPGMLNA